MGKKRVLAAGMLPPPLGGQALMFETVVKGLRPEMDVEVLNLQAQVNIGEAGYFSLRKFRSFCEIVLAAFVLILKLKRYDILYYCPSGPSNLGALKDIFLLGLLRPLARKTIYHFHGTGGVAHLLKMNRLLVTLAKRTLFKPDLAIRCAEVVPDDAQLCEAKESRIIFNGIPDPQALSPGPIAWNGAGKPRFCFIGALEEDKGIFDIVEIVRILGEMHIICDFNVIGEGTDVIINRFDALVSKYGLEDRIHRLGVLSGKVKFDLLASSAIFVFPSYFRAETQPLVLIEAIALGIPCVASDWRGIKTIVKDNINGYLFPPRDPQAAAEKIVQLLQNGRWPQFSEAARQHYKKHFSVETFLLNIRNELNELVIAK